MKKNIFSLAALLIASAAVFTACYDDDDNEVEDSAPVGVEAVDLGLSVKWANMNVGATSVTDYGKYYAWGAKTDNFSEGKSYDWANTPYFTGDSLHLSWSKYTLDAGTTLEASDDAATANWGGSWRMPTQEEFRELLDNTTKTWQTDYQGVSGCNGYLFTSKKIGYTDKSIFLPAAGVRDDDRLAFEGSFGYYWSSSLNSRSSSLVCFLLFEGTANWDTAEWNKNYNTGRCSGLSVRPVSAN